MQTRILMVLESTFPVHGGGGAESQVRTLGLHLPQRGLGVSVMVPMVPYGAQLVDDTAEGIPIRRLSYPKVPLIGAAIMLTKLAWRLFQTRHQYTFIHAHIAGNMAAVCCVMGHLLGKPVLVKLTGMTEMVGGILDPKVTSKTRIKRRCLRLATYYQATSSQIARMLAGSGFAADKIHLIPNAVDTQRFTPPKAHNAERLELCGERALVAIYVGRLEREKDLELMLHGWARAFKQRSDVALVIVGGGGLLEPLRALAQELGIDEQVIFVGPKSRVERYMPLADLGLLTSRAEGLSNTLLEYMASSLPVIGTRVSGTEDFVVDGQTGWLFPVGDVRQLQAHLEHAAQLGAEQLAALGQNAKHKVVTEASISAVLDRLIALYKSPRTP